MNSAVFAAVCRAKEPSKRWGKVRLTQKFWTRLRVVCPNMAWRRNAVGFRDVCRRMKKA